MRGSDLFVRAAFLLQLVRVIAGNDVITFNQDNYDEDNIDTVLETEHLIQVVDRHKDISRHVITIQTQTPVYQNSSPTVYSPELFPLSVPNRQATTSVAVNTKLSSDRDLHFDTNGENRHRSKSKATENGWKPSETWENTGYIGEESEDDLFGEGILPLNGDSSNRILSRSKRALAEISGSDIVKCQYDLNGRVNPTKEQIQSSLEYYLRKRFQGYNIDTQVEVTNITQITQRPGRRRRRQQSMLTIRVSATILYDDDIPRISMAQALYDLSVQDNFIVGNVTYGVAFPSLQPENNNTLIPAICLLCKTYQGCRQPSLLLEWECRVNDFQLFQFGPEQGDDIFEDENEYATINIRPPYPIAIGSELVSNIYVSANGIISFKEAFSSYSPVRCPVYNKNGKRLLWSVYWCDFDLKKNDKGRLYTHVYTTNSINNRAVMDKAKMHLRYMFGDFRFEPIMAIIITWYEVAPYRPYSNDERATFQAAIVTDGETTYAFYIYAQGAMQLEAVLKRQVEVCINDRNLDNYLNNYYKFSSVMGNSGSPGLWGFWVGYVQSSRTKCLRWFDSNLPNLQWIYFWNSIVEPCPCSEFSAWNSFRWIPSFLQPGCYDMYPIYGSVGRRCCYRWTRSIFDSGFENRLPYAGNLQLYTPYYGYLYWHELYDAAPKRWCCYESDLCNLYYIARPVQSCRIRLTWRAFFFGEPHIQTLDGAQYTFNGLGDYTLIEIPEQLVQNETVNFKLQGRTCRAQTSNGTLANATVFCALALQNTHNTSVTVEIDSSGDFMIIFVNKQDFSVRFRNSTSYRTTTGGIYMEKVNGSLRVSTPDDIGLTINLKYNLLDFSVEISDKYMGKTRGLMGNYNTNSTDDYIFSNGTVLPSTASERELYEFGKSWAVNESILPTPRDNSSTFSDPDFVPMFLDDVNATELAEAQRRCGGNDNIACVYDILATKNEELAKDSGDSISAFQNDEVRLSNSPPVVNGTLQLNVTVNETTTFTIFGSDPDNDTFKFVILPSSSIGSNKSFNYTEKNGTFTGVFMPVNLDEVSIGVAAEDSRGLQSEVAQMNITVCSGCSKHGNCSFAELIPNKNPYFSIATCDCDIPYSGDNCEEDKDGCENQPCPSGTNCTDISAEQETITMQAFSCSDCPKGYQLDGINGTKCEDIDECLNGTNPCDENANCTNNIGSYFCTCHDGFRRTISGRCVDINECVENQNNCDQICNNTVGSYDCSCYGGFKLDSNRFKCNRVSDPCQNLTNNCSDGCTNSSGGAKCYCKIGKKLAPDGYTCIDINECEENLCSQKCNNTDGSYICSCYPGYKLLEDNLSCDICENGKFGEDCKRECSCRGRAIRCDNVKGCVCEKNWTGPNCEDDVNECLTEVNLCSKDKICVNTNGSFRCDCPAGYMDTNNTGSCTNVNECDDRAVHNCSQICVDNPGSFTCMCIDGYNSFSNLCEDINECALGISGCQQKCINMDGSFNCDCQPGFHLDVDRKGCIKDLEPCRDFNITCEFTCDVVDGSPQCYCPDGYLTGLDYRTCIDINECNNGSNKCMDNCVNTIGSYNCTCRDGRELLNDQRNCRVCDGYHWGPNCGNDCACNPIGAQMCDPVNGCKCNSGWIGTNCERNIDLCSLNQTICPVNSTCISTFGSYLCQCNTGFQLDNSSNTCSDVNECDLDICDQDCTNSIGSYSCFCNSGFTADGDKCLDIDECVKPDQNECDQLCRNTLGSFACECNDGYTLNTTTRKTCYREPSTQSCGNCSICQVENGQVTCKCKPGYELGPDNTTCQDINECLSSPCINGTCTNTDGDFNCTCDSGWKLSTDEITCKACDANYYGQDCANSCSCVTTNTMECIRFNGTCTCKSGWQGNFCEMDINECSNTSYCPNAHDTCFNLNGSAECRCADGYYRPNPGAFCKECEAMYYGKDCYQTCNCTTSNTQNCNHINGTCTCKAGWKGSLCELDIDECSVNTSYCPNAHDTCFNLNGSAECRCDAGYYLPSSGGICQDVNECIDPIIMNCTQVQTCNNTDGGFVCVCKPGYEEIGGQCKSCDATHYGLNCLNNCTCVTANTKDCDDVNGTCTCNPGWEDINCNVSTACDATHYGENCLNNCTCVTANTKDCDDVNGTCTCNPGWEGINCNVSTACDATHYGENCLNNCTCVTANTEDCDDKNGTCTCKRGWAGMNCNTSAETYRALVTLDYSDAQISQFGEIFDNTTASFRQFASSVEESLFDYGKGIKINSLIGVKITNFIRGSVIANTIVYIDVAKSANPRADAAKLLYQLLQSNNLTINGTVVQVNSISIDNCILTVNSSLEDINNSLCGFNSNEKCVQTTGNYSCELTTTMPESSRNDLIIGLAVGIPLFIIATIVVALLALYYVRRKRRNQQQSSSQSVDHEASFRNMFATRISTKGSWGAPQQMFSHDAYSETGTNESGNGGLIKARQKGRSDFQDSAWYDNRGATPSGVPESRDTSTDPAGPTSNFSWEYMFRLLEPHRDFEIQRPYCEPTPNPAFIPKNRDPDSAA